MLFPFGPFNQWGGACMLTFITRVPFSPEGGGGGGGGRLDKSGLCMKK